MSYVVYLPGTTIRAFTRTEKMPRQKGRHGSSWNLPPVKSCPGMCTGEGAVCERCYGQRGNYLFGPVQRALEARYEFAMNNLGGEFERFMIAELAGQEFFRLHDCGDFASIEYVRAWTRIARALPETRFWAPTRTWRLGGEWLEALRELASLPNVVVRPSALYLNEPPPVVDGLSAGAGVYAKGVELEGYKCPAGTPEHGPSCGECRVCFRARKTPVLYKRK